MLGTKSGRMVSAGNHAVAMYDGAVRPFRGETSDLLCSVSIVSVPCAVCRVQEIVSNALSLLKHGRVWNDKKKPGGGRAGVKSASAAGFAT